MCDEIENHISMIVNVIPYAVITLTIMAVRSG